MEQLQECLCAPVQGSYYPRVLQRWGSHVIRLYNLSVGQSDMKVKEKCKKEKETIFI